MEHTCEFCGAEKVLVESYRCPNIIQDLAAKMAIIRTEVLDPMEDGWASGTS